MIQDTEYMILDTLEKGFHFRGQNIHGRIMMGGALLANNSIMGPS